MLAYARLARLADYKSRTAEGVEAFDYSKCKDPRKSQMKRSLCAEQPDQMESAVGFVSKRINWGI